MHGVAFLSRLSVQDGLDGPVMDECVQIMKVLFIIMISLSMNCIKYIGLHQQRNTPHLQCPSRSPPCKKHSLESLLNWLRKSLVG